MAKFKTDNGNLHAKLELRRYFLRKYHRNCPPKILDCCQGQGIIWKHLRQEFHIADYWGIDLNKKAGRLKIDSIRILQQAGWPQNVIDIDTYGSPWKHWMAMLPNVQKPTTVFLTIGQWHRYMGTDRYILKTLGLDKFAIPPGIICRLDGLALTSLLTKAYDHDITLHEAVEAVSMGQVRYIGVRLEPSTNRQHSVHDIP
jgi:hypothetical protein